VAKATTGSYNIPEKYPEETYDISTGMVDFTIKFVFYDIAFACFQMMI